MNKIGRKSIIQRVAIPNTANPKEPFNIRVQVNKNHGICDLVLTSRVVSKKDGKKKVSFVPVRRITEILTDFQGRQFDSLYVHEHLTNVLYELFNNAPAV